MRATLTRKGEASIFEGEKNLISRAASDQY
jgi:hypothetical protein